MRKACLELAGFKALHMKGLHALLFLHALLALNKSALQTPRLTVQAIRIT